MTFSAECPLASIQVLHVSALWWLALPLCLWFLLRRLPRPEERFLGTFALWSDSESSVPQEAQAYRARLPWSLWLALLALVVGVFGAVGLGKQDVANGRTYELVLDASASMYIVQPSGEYEGRTRLDEAVERGLNLLPLAPGDRVRWVRADRVPLLLHGRERPPAAWLEAPVYGLKSPHWPLWDRSNTLWLTDQIPHGLPTRAGLVATGGLAFPGPVALDAGRLVEWNGISQGLRKGEPHHSSVGIRLGDALLPPGKLQSSPLVSLFALWARERGHGWVSSLGAEPDLVLELLPASPEQPTCSIDEGRWTMRACGVGLADDGQLETWAKGLVGQTVALPLVQVGAGIIRVGLCPEQQVGGDPAAFAWSWCELFDRQLRLPPDVISWGERQSMGAAKILPPSPDGGTSSTVLKPQLAWIRWLVTLATVLGLLAVLGSWRDGWGRAS